MSSEHTGKPLVIAYYLPQFHVIPENNEWWGEGFTDWVNVRRALPYFDGHRQPAAPHPLLGEYDLSDADILPRQMEVARDYGVDAFCVYHYWFDGRRLLETPLDKFLRSHAEGAFLLCWANENWTRRWDGKHREVLLDQNFSPGFAGRAFESFLPYLTDHRYVQVDGRRPLVVHRVDHLPEPRKLAQEWRELARRRGLGDLMLIANETVKGLDPRMYGFDAVAEFPPVGSNDLQSALLKPPAGLQREFRGRLMSYERLASSREKRYMRPIPFVRFSGVAPGWDNSPRRRARATIYVGSTPDRYGSWLQRALQREAQREGQGIVFVNAWNEWAEGAMLEPSESDGHAYLEATRAAVEGSRYAWHENVASRELQESAGTTIVPWLRSLAYAAAGSILNRSRHAKALSTRMVTAAAARSERRPKELQSSPSEKAASRSWLE